MTVRELIVDLLQYNPDDPVAIRCLNNVMYEFEFSDPEIERYESMLSDGRGNFLRHTHNSPECAICTHYIERGYKLSPVVVFY